MTVTASAGGGGGGWTPPASLRSWMAQYDPDQRNVGGDPVIDLATQELLGASPGAFAKIEAQLLSTGQLAAITAQGLEDAKAASWQGEAGDQYRSTLSKLPADLQLVSDNYREALTALSAFADTTFELKAKYQTFQQNWATLKQSWAAALDQTYPSADDGWAAIHKLQGEMDTLSKQGLLILQDSVDAQQALNGKFGPLTGAAPHESLGQFLLSPFTAFWKGITGTWGAINAFANNPSWSNLGKMSGDLAIDASVLALAAALPEGAAGLGAIDVGADSAALSGLEDAGTFFKGVGVGESGLNTASDFADGDYAAGVLGLWGVGDGLDGAVDGSELDQALSEASLLDRYAAQFEADGAAGAAAGFSQKEIDELRELVPSYATDPSAVEEAAKEANQDLAKAGLVKEPADFLKDHFIEDPLKDAAAKAVDGNGDGKDGGNGG